MVGKSEMRERDERVEAERREEGREGRTEKEVERREEGKRK